MEYKRNSLKKAAMEVIHKKLRTAGGEGGLVALDKYGNVSMLFNTAGMYRGYRKSNGDRYIGSIYMKHYIFFTIIFSITSSISCVKSLSGEQEEYAVWNAFLNSKYAEKTEERIIYENAGMFF